MRRWIVIGAVCAFVFAIAAGIGLYIWRENRMTKVWVPLPLNAQVTEEQRQELTTDLAKKIRDPELMLKVAQETGLASKLDLPSDDAAAQEIDRHLFVELGEADTPIGRVPSINVGMNCKRKHFKLMGEVSTKIMEHVWKMLGIKPPEKQPF